MKKKPVTVTQAASDTFDIFMRSWQEKMNLRNWRVVRSNKAAGRGNMAEICDIDLEAMLAPYRLGKDFGSEPVTDRTLDRLACHECAHILLAELIAVCRDARSTDEQVNCAEHSIINTLVDLLSPEVD